MGMFYCNSCDHLIDSDAILFVYDWRTDYWTCQNCLDADEDVDTEQVLKDFEKYWTEEASPFKLMLFLRKAKNSNKRNLESRKE